MGAWLAAGAAAATLVLALVLRTRLPAAIGIVLTAATSAALAWGAVLIGDPSAPEAALAVAALAVMGPLHVHIVLGPFGPPR